METGTPEKRLGFIRRMLWWMPMLVFAVWAAVLVAVAVPAGTMTIMDVILQSLIVAVVVGVLVAGVYYGYKFMMERNPAPR